MFSVSHLRSAPAEKEDATRCYRSTLLIEWSPWNNWSVLRLDLSEPSVQAETVGSRPHLCQSPGDRRQKVDCYWVEMKQTIQLARKVNVDTDPLFLLIMIIVLCWAMGNTDCRESSLTQGILRNGRGKEWKGLTLWKMKRKIRFGFRLYCTFCLWHFWRLHVFTLWFHAALKDMNDRAGNSDNPSRKNYRSGVHAIILQMNIHVHCSWDFISNYMDSVIWVICVYYRDVLDVCNILKQTKSIV